MKLKACLNCGQESEAKYCSACGQSLDVKISTVWHFISETLDVIYNFDSKVWRSMLPLLFMPGKLTNEYIAGKRVRYLPPFRLYLILSILFFLVATIPEFNGFDNLSPEEREELVQGLEDSGFAINDFIAESNEQLNQNLQVTELPFNDVLQEGSEQISQNLQESRLALNDLIQANRAQRNSSQLSAELAGDEDAIDISSLISPPPGLFEGAEPPPPLGLTGIDDCVNIPWGEFLGARIGARALNSCQTAFSDNGVSLMQSFLDNLPIMMFFCVPLLAVFMKGLYIFKKRKYVEHLMFLFHAHSFIFALAIFTVLIARATELFPEVEDYIGFLLTIIWTYAAIYIFVALSRVYRQGIFMTSVKMIMLFPVYSICLALTFLSGLFLTFITI
jgi:hypothetical protein